MTTKKNKEQFEKWYNESPYGDYLFTHVETAYNTGFEELPLSMQWGVYLEYYDSLDVYKSTMIEIRYYLYFDAFDVYIYGEWVISCSTRQEAQTEALKKADEIANSRIT